MAEIARHLGVNTTIAKLEKRLVTVMHRKNQRPLWGPCDTVGRRSPVSLYRPDLATFESETVYDQKDAEGFIRLNALRLRVGTKTGR